MTGAMADVAPVVGTEQVLALRAACEGVFVDPLLMQHAVRLAAVTRDPEAHGVPDIARYIVYGASPRASINLIIAARALAFVRGRTYVIPQDVSDLVHDVMRHRIIPSYEALSEGVTTDDILQKVMQAVPAPAQVLQSHAAGVI
jgi:MoxR-like ATPase